MTTNFTAKCLAIQTYGGYTTGQTYTLNQTVYGPLVAQGVLQVVDILPYQTPFVTQSGLFALDSNGNAVGVIGTNGLNLVTPYRAFTGAPNVGTSSLSNVVLQTVTIPKGMFTSNSRIRIDSLWTANSGANQKFQNVYINTIGAGLSGAAQLLGYNFTANQSMGSTVWMWNKNSLTSQIAGYATTLSPNNTFNSPLVASAFDTSQGLDVIFAAQVANIADNSTLAAYSVELLN